MPLPLPDGTPQKKPEKAAYCPHGFLMDPHPERMKQFACQFCQEALDHLLEDLRWGEA